MDELHGGVHRRDVVRAGGAVATAAVAGCVGGASDDDDERETYDSATITVSASGQFWRGDIRFFDGNTLTRVPLPDRELVRVTLPDDVPDVQRVQSPIHVSVDVSDTFDADGPLELLLEVDGEEVGRKSTTDVERVEISHP